MDYFAAALALGAAFYGGLAWGTLLRRRSAATTPEPTPVPVRSRAEIRDIVHTYVFPAQMLDRALARCPEETDAYLVELGLRQYLTIAGAAMGSGRSVAMPSRTVDEAWHEFITYTRDYATFCQSAFGQMLHHQPVATMTTEAAQDNATAAMVRAWEGACELEGLNPETTSTAPALFAADAGLASPGRPTSGRAPTWVGSCGRTSRCPEGVQCARHQLYGEPGTASGRRGSTPRGGAHRRSDSRGSSPDLALGGGVPSAVTAASISDMPVRPAQKSTCGSTCGSPQVDTSSSGSWGSDSGSSSSSSSCGSSCGGGCGS